MSGRIRTLKPEWLDDEKLGKLSDATRVLSAGLVLLADDYGNGRAHPLFVASRTWGYGDPHESLRKAEDGLRELTEMGFIQLYQVHGQAYFHLRNWVKHQRVQHPGKPRIPGPDEAEVRPASGPPPDDAPSSSGDPHESLTPDHRSPITDQDQRSTTASADPPRARRGAHARTHARGTNGSAKLTWQRVVVAFDDWREALTTFPTDPGSFEREAKAVLRQARAGGRSDSEALALISSAVAALARSRWWERESRPVPDFGHFAKHFSRYAQEALSGEHEATDSKHREELQELRDERFRADQSGDEKRVAELDKRIVALMGERPARRHGRGVAVPRDFGRLPGGD